MQNPISQTDKKTYEWRNRKQQAKIRCNCAGRFENEKPVCAL